MILLFCFPTVYLYIEPPYYTTLIRFHLPFTLCVCMRALHTYYHFLCHSYREGFERYATECMCILIGSKIFVSMSCSLSQYKYKNERSLHFFLWQDLSIFLPYYDFQPKMNPLIWDMPSSHYLSSKTGLFLIPSLLFYLPCNLTLVITCFSM